MKEQRKRQDKKVEEKREKQRQLADFLRKQAAERILKKNQPSSKGFDFSEIISCASYIEPDAGSIKSSLRAK